MLTAELVKRRLKELDLEPIKFKLATSEGYGPAEIAVIDEWYRRFLFMAWKLPDVSIVVPEQIDAMWHHHILDTRKYADDCGAVFGTFLHHFPYFGLRGSEDAEALRTAFRNSNDLMMKEYGATPGAALAELRPEWTQEEAASSCSDCSGVWPNAFTIPGGAVRPTRSQLLE